jgi:dCTP deaminase
MGPEVYISPTEDDDNAKNATVRVLQEREGFTIPPGQFAFLLTEEIITVPPTAMAFISMKAKVKWRGLINVSGFHVDPGFKGRLVFAVFNAGPVVVHLRRGDDLFLIWFADLKAPTALHRDKPVQEHITSELISGISGELQSLPGLNSKIKSVEEALGDKVHAVEKSQEALKTQVTILTTLGIALVVGLGLALLKWVFTPDAPSNPASPAAIVNMANPTASPLKSVTGDVQGSGPAAGTTPAQNSPPGADTKIRQAAKPAAGSAQPAAPAPGQAGNPGRP